MVSVFMSRLHEQVAVVTGASSGVGKAIALHLAAEGTVLCLVGRNLKSLDATADIARKTASRVLSYQLDLTRDKEIQNLVASLERDIGRVDLLIHSAGLVSMGSIADAPVDDFDQQHLINVRAPYVLTQALLPMLRVRPGQIVFVNSSLAFSTKTSMAEYAATKHALKAIADGFRNEANADGVRVLSVFLGRTATPMQRTIFALEGRLYHPESLLQPEDVASVITNALTLPRTAEVTDISIRPLLKSKE
jgi:NADP-dependent 3-hydroxy acid dehydrogenase YdfG